MLLGEGFRQYGMDMNATVQFMKRHSEVLGADLRAYYESVGDVGGPSLNKAIDRLRCLKKKTLDLR